MRVEKNTSAIVLAGGSGKRMKSKIRKQYIEIHGKPLIYYSLAAFQNSAVEKIVLVCSAGDEEYCLHEIVEKYSLNKVCNIVSGGKERYHSVYEGLKALKDTEYVLIHDGARPFVTNDIIQRSIECAKQYKACVVGMPTKDTIKISDENGFVKSTPNRSSVWNIQTPQSFEYNLIKEAYEKIFALENSLEITDDAMVVESTSDVQIKLLEGSYMNIKITTPDDLIGIDKFLNEI